MSDVTFRPWKVDVRWQAGDEDDPPGFVAFAALSDGTLSWPMGARSHPVRRDAVEQGKLVRMINGSGAEVDWKGR